MERCHRTTRHNVLVFAARGRAVKRERLGNYVGGLERKLDDQDGSTAAYLGFVEGERLDAMVRSDRLGFEIDEDEDDLFEGSKSLSSIRDGALDAVREDLGAVLGKIRERKEEAVHQYVAEQAPEYRRLVKTQKDRVLEALPANPKKREIEAALGRVLLERQADLKEEGKALLAFEPETDTLEKYKQQMEGVLAKFEDLDQTALAQHVIHRRIVLNLLDQALSRDDDTGRYQLEAVVHRLIHPMRKGSDEVEFEEQNLWVLDDRLTYHEFLELDKGTAGERAHGERLAHKARPASRIQPHSYVPGRQKSDHFICRGGVQAVGPAKPGTQSAFPGL